MGRHATICIEDVRLARDELRSAGRPHGIIAIRNAIGKGSPALIGRFLDDLSDEEAEPDARPLSSPVETDPGATRSLRRHIESLERELQAQRTIFENYRRDHVRDRAALAHQIEKLTHELSSQVSPSVEVKPKRAPAPATLEQLDLYGEA